MKSDAHFWWTLTTSTALTWCVVAGLYELSKLAGSPIKRYFYELRVVSLMFALLSLLFFVMTCLAV